jgi:hypothetical protein
MPLTIKFSKATFCVLSACLMLCCKKVEMSTTAETTENVTMQARTALTTRVKNTTFDVDTTFWGTSFSLTTSGALSGKSVALNGSTRKIQQYVPVSSNKYYVFSAFIKGGANIGVKDATGTNILKVVTDTAAVWKKVEAFFGSGSNASVLLYGSYYSVAGMIDNVSLDSLSIQSPTTLSLAVGSPTSIILSWTDLSKDITGYKIERKIGNGAWTQIDTKPADTTSTTVTYTNTGLSANTQYSYRVKSYTSWGYESSYTNEMTMTLNTSRTVNVSTATQLKAALLDAQPGDDIILADGTYSGKFVITSTVSGTASNIITIRGSRNAILDAGSLTTGYVLHHQANYWKIKGFTIRNGLKGLMLDGANYNLIDSIKVTNIGTEAIHFRKFSSNNILQYAEVNNTGLQTPSYGEGIYVGSANSNWADYTNGLPDRCDSNIVQYNTVGPNCSAECIDVKEGTTGGIYRYNTFNSDGISGANSADSWMDVKGNNNLIENNTGTNPSTETDFTNGFEVHLAYTGWGYNNKFKSNSCTMNRGSGAYAVYIPTSTLNTTVCTSNTIIGAGTLSNQTTVSCP